MKRIRYATCLLILLIGNTSAYVIQSNFDIQGSVHTFRWRDGTGYYRIDETSLPVPATTIRSIVSRAFSAWTSVSTASLNIASTSSSNSLIRFVTATDGSIPQGIGVIALTRLEIGPAGGIISAEILFNSREIDFSFSAGSPPAGRIDFQDVLTHEIGHFLGLDHAPYLGPRADRPTMTPFYLTDFPIARRTLEQDDISGLTALYKDVHSASSTTGTVSGLITDEGQGVFGAHVVVTDAGSGTFVASGLAGQYTGPRGSGEYVIEGLPPGDYRIRVEPLSGSISGSDFAGIFRTGIDRGFASTTFPPGPTAGIPISIRAGTVFQRADISTSSSPSGLSGIAIEHPKQALVVATPTVRTTFTVASGNPLAPLLFHRLVGAEGYTPVQMALGRDGWFAGLPSGAESIEYRLLLYDSNLLGTLFPPLSESPFVFTAATFTHDLVFVALRSSNEAAVIHAGTGEVLARYDTGDRPTDVLLSPNGKRLFVTNPGDGGQGRDVTIVDVSEGRVEETLDVGDGPLDIALAPDGRIACVTLSTGRGISVLDVASGSIFRTVTVPTGTTGPFGIAMHPTDPRIYLTDPALDRILDLSSETFQFEFFIDTPPVPRSVALSHDGDRLFVAGFEGHLGIIDTGSRQLVQTITTGALSLYRLVHLPKRDLVYATDPLGANLVRIDLMDFRSTLISTSPHSFDPRDVVVSSDPDTLYVSGGVSNTILVVVSETGSIARVLDVPGGPRGLAISPASATSQPADFDSDGKVGFTDFLLFANSFGSSAEFFGFDARMDLDSNGSVDFADFILFAEAFGR